jgi:hypothetical protein
MKGGVDLIYVGAVGPDGFVELVAGDAELFRPVSNVGGHFWVDLFGIMRALGVLFVNGVGFVGLGCVVMLGHGSSFSGALVKEMRKIGVGMYCRCGGTLSGLGLPVARSLIWLLLER